jgi:hypothetical protein
VIKFSAVRRPLFFEEIQFDEFGDRVWNLGRPLPKGSIQHPPLKDILDGAACIRVAGQIIENFWYWRWKSWVREHALSDQPVVKQLAYLDFQVAKHRPICANDLLELFLLGKHTSQGGSAGMHLNRKTK